MGETAAAPAEQVPSPLRLVAPSRPVRDPDRDEALAWIARRRRWERRLDDIRSSEGNERR